MLIDPETCYSQESTLPSRLAELFPTSCPLSSQGGSYVKGTDTQGCSEIDIVLLSEVFADVNHFKKQLREGLETLRESLTRTAYGNRSG